MVEPYIYFVHNKYCTETHACDVMLVTTSTSDYLIDIKYLEMHINHLRHVAISLGKTVILVKAY